MKDVTAKWFLEKVIAACDPDAALDKAKADPSCPTEYHYARAFGAIKGQLTILKLEAESIQRSMAAERGES